MYLKNSRRKVLVIFFVTLWSYEVSGYKILGLFPYNGKSHFNMIEPIMKELVHRGHTVHVLGHFPLAEPLKNYTDLSVKDSIPFDTSMLQFKLFEYTVDYPFFTLFSLKGIVLEHENVMYSETVQKLLKSEETYDLIITESFFIHMTLGFVKKFKAPFIFLCQSLPPPWTSQFVANPIDPSYIPSFISFSNNDMTFMERVQNAIEVGLTLVYWKLFMLPPSDEIMRRSFGDETLSIQDIAKEASLILMNTHFTVTGVRPSVPAVIEVGGVHIGPVRKLPKDIEEFIENSPHGVIYFCMGSLLRAASWPQEKKTAFMNAFSQLNERVLWKFEDENATFSKNIMIKKWMPQRDILAHPKVKLFISHGGFMGTLEAVSAGKPILAIPMFADQLRNVRVLEARGTAKYLKYNSINNQTVLDHLREILKPKYGEKTKELSEEFHDRPMSPMDTAIFWIEYVIRRKGARNLRSAAVDLPFYKYLLLDVISFILIVTFVVLIVLKKCVQSLVNKELNNLEKKKKKV